MKDKNLYPSTKIYYGKCKQCGEDYVGETERNCVTRWKEHNDIMKERKSEPARHIISNIDHEFEWSILCHASAKKHLRKNLEALFIGIIKPSLNEQTNFKRLILFVNGIT